MDYGVCGGVRNFIGLNGFRVNEKSMFRVFEVVSRVGGIYLRNWMYTCM